MVECEMPTPTVTKPARRSNWTYADYCKIPPDRHRHEIIDGRHYVTPSPEIGHQRAGSRLVHQLMAQIDDVGLGETFSAPLDVHLGRGTVVQPDLVVVHRDNRAVLGTKKVTGVPDLLVEILSPSSGKRDRTLKRDRYERAGVREYWLVDREARVVQQFVLRGGVYSEPLTCAEHLRCRVFRGVVIDVTRLW